MSAFLAAWPALAGCGGLIFMELKRCVDES
jgi:hypothetical protein